MDAIVIDMPPYSGRYEFDFAAEYTNAELAWIKRHSGYQPATVSDGLAAGDAELWCVLGAIALCRNRKIDGRQVQTVFDLLMTGAYSTTVEPDITSDEGDADPTSTPTESTKPGSSGVGSGTSSGSQETPRNGSGTPVLGSSVLPPVRSGI